MADANAIWFFSDDLGNASKIFNDASINYKGCMPNVGFGCPKCSADEMLDVTLRTIGEMHLILAQALAQHSGKLSRAANEYKQADDQTTDHIAQIMDTLQGPDWGAPPRSDPPMLPSDRTNLARKANFTLKSLPAIKVKTPGGRAVPAKCGFAFIDDGDYPGLYNLAGELYNFASQSGSEVEQLATYVEKLAGDTGDWHGYAATAFRYSFGGDAIMMNGLARISAAVAAVVDDLASRVASIESHFEQVVQWGLDKGYFQWINSGSTLGQDYVAENITGGYVILTPKCGADREHLYQTMLSLAGKSRTGVAKLYQRANTELAVLCAPISDALDWYTSPNGQQFEREPNGLLRADQLTNDNIGVGRLQKQFTAANSNAGLTAADVSAISGELVKLGGEAATVGNIVGAFKGNAIAQFLQSGSTALSTLGAVVDDIGMAAVVVAAE